MSLDHRLYEPEQRLCEPEQELYEPGAGAI